MKLSVPKEKWQKVHRQKIFKYAKSSLIIGASCMVVLYFISSIFGTPTVKSQFSSSENETEEVSPVDMNPLRETCYMLCPEVWEALSAQEKLDILFTIETYEAQQVGRPACIVQAQNLSDNTLGKYNSTTAVITIDIDHLDQSHVSDILSTLLHEGRHAQQAYLCDYFEDNGFLTDEVVLTNAYFSDIREWKRAFDEKALTETFEEYYTSAIEVDARTYAYYRLHTAREYELVFDE